MGGRAKRVFLGLPFGLGLLVSAAIAGQAAGEAPRDNLMSPYEFQVEGAFSPRYFPRARQTPISVTIAAEMRSESAEEPPAIRKLVVEFDKAMRVHTAGIPACGRSRLAEGEISAALHECRSSLVGEGEATVGVAYPGLAPIDVNARILAFKGGEGGGKTTLLLDAFFAKPIAGSIVIPAVVEKHPYGAFGTRAVVSIPRIAGGAGSLRKFDLEIFRKVDVEGRAYDPISAACRDGKLRVRVEARVEDGTKYGTEVVRACAPD